MSHPPQRRECVCSPHLESSTTRGVKRLRVKNLSAQWIYFLDVSGNNKIFNDLYPTNRKIMTHLQKSHGFQGHPKLPGPALHSAHARRTKSLTPGTGPGSLITNHSAIRLVLSTLLGHNHIDIPIHWYSLIFIDIPRFDHSKSGLTLAIFSHQTFGLNLGISMSKGCGFVQRWTQYCHIKKGHIGKFELWKVHLQIYSSFPGSFLAQ